MEVHQAAVTVMITIILILPAAVLLQKIIIAQAAVNLLKEIITARMIPEIPMVIMMMENMRKL